LADMACRKIINKCVKKSGFFRRDKNKHMHCDKAKLSIGKCYKMLYFICVGTYICAHRIEIYWVCSN
jgi:hypothetical protein